MALEKKRKSDQVGHDGVPQTELENVATSKKPKLSHNSLDAKDTKHIGIGVRNVIVHGKSRKRHRKKKLYDEICQQMEFYFSDANLSKSKYMNDEISKDEGGWVNLDIFLRFNKLVEMMKMFFGSVDLDDLWNALSFRLKREKEDRDDGEPNSILEIRQQDNGLQQIRRSKPIRVKTVEEVENCTVYIENLPPFVTNDSLKKMFGENHGPVDYVSLPRYKHNRAIKGFAFVEFADVKGAESAIKRFEHDVDAESESNSQATEESQRIQPSLKDPAELQSIKSFQVEQAIERGINIPTAIEVKDEKAEEKNEQPPTKDSAINQSLNEVPNAKKDSSNLNALNTTSVTSETDVKVSHSDTASPEEKTDPTGKDGNVETLAKKKRKRRNKNKVVPMTMQNSQNAFISIPDGCTNNLVPLNGVNNDEYVFSLLRIMTKEEWRKMRNKYLNLQKLNMSQAKGRMQQMKPVYKDKNKESQVAKAVSYTSQTASSIETQSTGHKATIEFVPGTIVRFNLEEPVVDQGKQVKSRLRAAVMEPVKYVDAHNGNNTVFVRCSNRKQSEVLASAKNLLGNSCGEILSGVEESEYWDKIRIDRQDKISGKIKVKPSTKKERGKDRVVRKYEEAIRNNSHKFFDDGEADD